MSLFLVTLLQIVVAVATIVIFSSGLAVIFGMMGVINLAHGEFMMVGGYAAVLTYERGVNLWVAMLVIAPVSVGLLGWIVEWTLIRRLYGNMVSTLLATWGLSLFLVGAVSTVFGSSMSGVPTPLGSFAVGEFRLGAYRLALVAIAMLICLAIYCFLRFTGWGLIARATMQNRDMTSALGVDPQRVYSVTFVAGAALSGLAGGLMAPLTGITPTMGAAFVAKSFITVIAGGESVIVGMSAAAGLFGTINHLVSYGSTPVIGEAAMLAVAILLLRFLPNGVLSLFRRSART